MVILMFEIIREKGTFDNITKLKGYIYEVNRKWEEPAREFYFRVRYDFEPKHWIIPGVAYDGNKQGKGIFPRPSLDEEWYFREDRVTIPSAAIVEDDEKVLAIFTEPAKSEEEISSVMVRRGLIAIRIPWQEIPKSYTAKNIFSRRKITKFKKPRKYSRTFYIISANFKELGYKRGYYLVLEEAWNILKKDVKVDYDKLEYFLKLKTEYALNVHYFRLGKVSGFITMVTPTGIALVPAISAGFVGKSLEMALSLYRIYMVTGDKKLKEIAFRTAYFHCSPQLDNGLLPTDFHLTLKTWFGYSLFKRKWINTRVMGEAGYFLLRLYQYAKERGEENELWLKTVKKLANFFVEHQLPNGSFGKWWSPDGKKVSDDGTNGAYIIWMLVELYKMTGEKKYLEAAEKGMNYYIKKFVENDLYWGDTLDADTIDKEAGHAIMRAALLLYEVTKNKKYLEAAERAGYYIMTWMFFWNVPFCEKTTLGRNEYKTFGGTIVSVENQHLDIYGIGMAPDFIRLYKFTGKDLWKEVAEAMVWNAMQIIANPKNTYGLSKFFYGFQPEQFNHTTWAYVMKTSEFDPLHAIFCIIPKIVEKIEAIRDSKWVFYPCIGKGDINNNILWVVALWIGGALDYAELQGIRLNPGEIKPRRDIMARVFRFLRNVTALFNIFA